MVLRCIGITILAILASTTATGTDFHVSARVDVIATLSVSLASPEGADDPGRAIFVQGTQDQCLEVSVISSGGAAVVAGVPGVDTARQVYVVTRDSSPFPDGAVPTIQILVN